MEMDNNLLLLSISTSTDEHQEDPSEYIETLLNKHNVPTQGREEWIAADVNDSGYHEYTVDKIIKIARRSVECKKMKKRLMSHWLCIHGHVRQQKLC